MKRKMSSWAYGAEASAAESTPRTGNAARGSSDVTGIATASVIHQIAIQAATAPVRCAIGSSPGGAGRRSTATATEGPAQRPTLRSVDVFTSGLQE